MTYLDIHTHHPCSDSEVDSRMSYRPSEQVLSNGYYSIGLHPCFPEDMTDESYNLLEIRCKSEPFVWAIGECGLDKNSPIDWLTQVQFFKKQIQLSEDLNLPVVIHCVRSFNEVIQLRKKLKPQQIWIVHGFRKNLATANQLLGAGMYLSFGKYFHPDSFVRAYQLNRAFLETDMSDISIKTVYQEACRTLREQSIMEISPKLSIFAPRNKDTYEQEQ